MDVILENSGFIFILNLMDVTGDEKILVRPSSGIVAGGRFV